MEYGYIRDTWDCGDTLEIEEKHTGKYGAKGQARKEKKEPTAEDIRRQNQWKRERDVRRLIKWNFKKNDYWLTVTYRKGDRPSGAQMQKDVQKLIRKVREKYRKAGYEMKYIYRLGIGKRGGPHVHMLVNRIPDADVIISTAWDKGHVNFRTMADTDGVTELAKYIVKPLEEWEQDEIKRYHPSRNLIRKNPTRKTIRRRRLADRRGEPIWPKAPKGYYVDTSSVRIGRNMVTGYYYRHYTLVRIQKERKRE